MNLKKKKLKYISHEIRTLAKRVMADASNHSAITHLQRAVMKIASNTKAHYTMACLPEMWRSEGLAVKLTY